MGGKKKKCFVIMPISDTDGYDNGHFIRGEKRCVSKFGRSENI